MGSRDIRAAAQRHLALDMNGAGNGPIWGHWVSRDFVHWAQLPVAIWNDQYYDNRLRLVGSLTHGFQYPCLFVTTYEYPSS
jgi:sucrose-6-phosphate hydrolase SacC (GH32 family)